MTNLTTSRPMVATDLKKVLATAKKFQTRYFPGFDVTADQIRTVNGHMECIIDYAHELPAGIWNLGSVIPALTTNTVIELEPFTLNGMTISAESPLPNALPAGDLTSLGHMTAAEWKALTSFREESDTRPILQGVLANPANGEFCATDGAIFLTMDQPMLAELSQQYVLPAFPAMGDGELFINEKDNIAEWHIPAGKKFPYAITLRGYCLHGQFPAYDRVIPDLADAITQQTTTAQTLIADTHAVIAITKKNDSCRMDLVNGECVKKVGSDTMNITVEPIFPEALPSLLVDVRYWKTVLEAFPAGDALTVCLYGMEAPIMFTTPGVTAVMFPLRQPR